MSSTVVARGMNPHANAGQRVKTRNSSSQTNRTSNIFSAIESNRTRVGNGGRQVAGTDANRGPVVQNVSRNNIPAPTNRHTPVTRTGNQIPGDRSNRTQRNANRAPVTRTGNQIPGTEKNRGNRTTRSIFVDPRPRPSYFETSSYRNRKWVYVSGVDTGLFKLLEYLPFIGTICGVMRIVAGAFQMLFSVFSSDGALFMNGLGNVVRGTVAIPPFIGGLILLTYDIFRA